MFQFFNINYDLEVFPLHKHRTYEILAFFQAKGIVHTPTENISVGAGSIVIIPPGIPHRVTPESGLRCITILGNFDSVFHLNQPVSFWDNAEEEGATLIKMIWRNRNENSSYIASLCNSLSHFILGHLSADASVNNAVRKIVYEITENFHDHSLNLNHLLNTSGYAEDYIRAQFKRITRKTPTAFLNDVRVKHACYLIEVYSSTLPLYDIAAQCGYIDYVFFSKRFKLEVGISPREYRDRVVAEFPPSRPEK